MKKNIYKENSTQIVANSFSPICCTLCWFNIKNKIKLQNKNVVCNVTVPFRLPLSLPEFEENKEIKNSIEFIYFSLSFVNIVRTQNRKQT